jgi:hypothetical protein
MLMKWHICVGCFLRHVPKPGRGERELLEKIGLVAYFWWFKF